MTETNVFIFDDFHPEDNAMVQALYSRSPDSVLTHRAKVEEVGSGKFMGQYYVGYGHASIGDCGSTTIFIENVSMLVAKAIQDSGLYSGQEASTRYLDFSTRTPHDPYNHAYTRDILDGWMELYNEYMPLTIEGLKRLHPFDPEEGRGEKAWLKAIEVRAFDVLRGLLPVGTTTLLSWHTNLRQVRDHLRHLSSHPLDEVRDIANRIFAGLKEKYPNSFHGEEMDETSERFSERNAYAKINAVDNHYLTPYFALKYIASQKLEVIASGGILEQKNISIPSLNEDPAIQDRPRGTLLPRRFMQYGVYNLTFLLDFGSWRDLQRHRNGYCPVPLVTGQFGFHKPYDDELRRILSGVEYTRLRQKIDDQLKAIDTLGDIDEINKDPLKDQYLYPMGVACVCTVSYSVPQMVYVGELRSAKTVHFSLRPIAQMMGEIVASDVPGLNLYIDYDEDSFVTKRGEQDIVAK